jgi:hypothetical protein
VIRRNDTLRVVIARNHSARRSTVSVSNKELIAPTFANVRSVRILKAPNPAHLSVCSRSPRR